MSQRNPEPVGTKMAQGNPEPMGTIGGKNER